MGSPLAVVHSLATRQRKTVKKETPTELKWSAKKPEPSCMASRNSRAMPYTGNVIKTMDHSRVFTLPTAPLIIIVRSENICIRQTRTMRTIRDKRRTRKSEMLFEPDPMSKERPRVMTIISTTANKTTMTSNKFQETSLVKYFLKPECHLLISIALKKNKQKLPSMNNHPTQSGEKSALIPMVTVLMRMTVDNTHSATTSL
mmetsp:Transcript_19734/g.63714  ORF Transcript_19734/g.63714 Transcript_19734/m.63714 type:complete len:201 (-) Transcript_19734:719-1321(-)